MSDMRPFIQAVAAAAARATLPSGVKSWTFEVSDAKWPFARFRWVDATGESQSLPVQIGAGRPQDWRGATENP